MYHSIPTPLAMNRPALSCKRFRRWAGIAAALGPPPPDVRTLAWGGLTIWLFVAWAWWCDRRREPVA